ncbi:MAG: ABC transporter permease, partial [Gemmatimonadetes bacterium]|nr:ABC transporter permease [Gemmatimonadota bacterium]
VVNGVLLRPLPYPDPERLVLLGERNPRFDMPLGWTSVPNYVDWRNQTTTFEHLALFRGRSRALTGGDQPLDVYSAMVTANFFSTFGVSPVLGRGFLEQENDPGAEPVVVLSHNLWERRYEADSAIVGPTILVDATARTVVGVMPPGFDAPARWIMAGISMDLWIPFPLAPASAGRDNRSYNVVGRLTPGVTVAEAQADMNVISARLRDAYPNENTNWSIGMAGWRDSIVGSVRSALMLMWAAVTLVLLIACANVANLKLNRMLSRRGEIAVRVALGAGRRRLMRQIFTESVVLAILGGTLGLALAVGGVELILALNPGNIPMADGIGIDAKVLTVTLVTTLVTGLLFGALPAIYASRPDLANEIKLGAGRSPDAGRHHTRSLVAVTQLVLAFTLLIGASLVAKSFSRLTSVSPGLNPHQVFTATVALSRSRVPTIEERAAFVTAALERLRTLPGIESVAMINSLPFTGSNATMPVSIEGQPAPPLGQQPAAAFRGISPGYFRTMEIPLLRGRDFDNRDLANPQTVLINETMARRHWPNEDPIGKRFSIMGQGTMLTVIGLVGDVKHYGLDADARPEVYQPYSTEYLTSKTFVLRTAGDPTVLGPTVERAILSVDPDQPIRDMATMEERVGRTIADSRFNTVMIGLASLVAVILAAIGLFGTVSYTVTARTQEIGVRMAMGA